MRVRTQLAMTAEEIENLEPNSMEYIKNHMEHLFARACSEAMTLEEGDGPLPGSKVFTYDTYLITKDTYIRIMEILHGIRFVGAPSKQESLIQVMETLLKE